MVPVFSRHYSPEEYGSIDLIVTVTSFVAIFGMLQLETAISRYYFEVAGVRRKQYISTGFWAILVVSLFLSLTILLLSESIAIWVFDSKELASVIKLASINILALNLFGYLTVLLRFQNRPVLYSGVIFSQVASTVTFSIVLLYYLNFGLYAFFAGQLIGLIVGILILVTKLRKLLLPYISKSILTSFMSYSLPQVPAVAGNWANSYVNRFVMLGFLSVSDIGIYTVALKIASVFNVIDNAFRMAWEPFIWERIKKEGHRKLLQEISTAITYLVFSGALLLALFAEELLLILSTSAYDPAIPLIKILLFAFSFPLLVQVFGIGTSIAKKTIYNTIAFFMGLGFNVILMLALVGDFGLVGVPISLMLGNMLIFILMWIFSEKLYFVGFSIGKFISSLFAFLLLGYVIYVFQIELLVKLLIVIGILIIVLFVLRRYPRIYLEDEI